MRGLMQSLDCPKLKFLWTFSKKNSEGRAPIAIGLTAGLHVLPSKAWLHDWQAGQGTKFTEIQRKSIKNRILAAASAAGHALGLEPDRSKGRAKGLKKKNIVIVGDEFAPAQDFFQASGYDVHVCSRSAADGWTPVLPTSPFLHRGIS